MQYYVNHRWVQVVGFLVGVVGAPCAVGLWIGMLVSAVPNGVEVSPP
jgi:uncharacterized membrane protein